CLIGDRERIQPVLTRARPARPIEVVHTTEFIGMDEAAGPALRHRKDASMVMAAHMVKEGQAQGMVCAGNTGALHQVALLEVGRLPGIKRPALAAVFPTSGQPSLCLDMGANADCKKEYLLQFAMMGSVYAQKVMGRHNPRVGLLNIGKEEGKGSTLVADAYELLSHAPRLNFVGNVEPMGFFAGDVDVGVCDGFVGNMMLKTAEAVAEWLMGRVREAARSSAVATLGGALLKPALKNLRRDVSHSEHGGAVLLGLRGVVVKCHGRATRETIENGIRVAERAVDNQVVERIASNLAAEEVQV
ncbi:MAG: phosphate acyltransferase PlsX, partial [Candidatus Eremiobacterota bacterium]